MTQFIDSFINAPVQRQIRAMPKKEDAEPVETLNDSSAASSSDSPVIACGPLITIGQTIAMIS